MEGTNREWALEALTPIWTGSIWIENDRERTVNERLVTTGLLGSIRWWFEVLVRGLGGSACDPSSTKCQDRKHCVVCELFGCTGWARKFRFQVLAGHDGDQIQSQPIKKNAPFRFRFVPLHTVTAEEWTLLDLALRLIADYGAVGGKTVLKPSDEQGRASARHHVDYGLVKLVSSPGNNRRSQITLEKYVRDNKWHEPQQGEFAWASLTHFWLVKDKYLARQSAQFSTFNRVIGRPEAKQQAGGNDSWLAGRRPRQNVDAESKKVFSFKAPARTFGFVNPGTAEFEAIKQRLKQAWPDLRDEQILKGDEILNRLLAVGTETGT